MDETTKRLRARIDGARSAGDSCATVDAIIAFVEWELEQGNPAEASAEAAMAIRLARSIQHPCLNLALGLRASADLMMGDRESAARLFDDAREAATRSGDLAAAAKWDRAGAATVAVSSRDDFEAIVDDLELEARLYGELDAARLAGAPDRAAQAAVRLAVRRVRSRHLDEGFEILREAMELAKTARDDVLIAQVGEEWSIALAKVHRLEESIDLRLEVARRLCDSKRAMQLLDAALTDAVRLVDEQRVALVLSELERRARLQFMPPEKIERVRQKVRQRLAPPRDRGVPILEDYLREALRQPGHHAIQHAAQLLCDVLWGLGAPAGLPLPGYLDDPSVPIHVMSLAIDRLSDAGESDALLELSQRYKGLGFAVPNLEHFAARPHRSTAERSFADAHRELIRAVQALRGPVSADAQVRITHVRSCGESCLAAGAVLAEVDFELACRLGVPARRADLLVTLPVDSPVAIVDLFCGESSTQVLVVSRTANDVSVRVLVAPLGFEGLAHLIEVWAKSTLPTAFGRAQAEALDEISSKLSPLTSGLGAFLAEQRIAQITLVNDPIARLLPVHLGRVRSSDVAVVVDALRMDPKPEAARCLAEAFAIDHAPCLQAIALSAEHKRRSALKGVVVASDPAGDLPYIGDATTRWITRIEGRGLPCVLLQRGEVLRAPFERALRESDLAVLGTHGVLDLPDPLRSHLRFADGPWSIRDIVAMPRLESAPVVVLIACSVGIALPSPNPGADSGLPGALISAGASAVIATLWPLEDVSGGFVAERLLHHLAHPGFSPSAALFRAVHDLRTWPREEVLVRCNELMARLVEEGESAAALRMDQLVSQIEEHGHPFPFAHPLFWGGLVVVGSGWRKPAAAMVTSASVESAINVAGTLERARIAVREGHVDELLDLARSPHLLHADAHRAEVCLLAAQAVWNARRPGLERSARFAARSWMLRGIVAARGENTERLDALIGAVKSLLDEPGGEADV